MSPRTVTIYLSDLKLAHGLRGFNTDHFDDIFVKKMIKGSENLLLYTSICKKTRLVMTFPLLKLLGHEIAKSNWTVDSKRVFWTAYCVTFFGSFWLGEILNSYVSNPGHEVLRWNDVQISPDHATIHIRFPKILRSQKGDFVDIFPFKGCCPLGGLRVLKEQKTSLVQQNAPVFTFDNGQFLTPDTVSKAIQKFLEIHIGSEAKHFTGHSFRAGIPAALANSTELISDEDIKKWGRWSSNSFEAYTRLKLSARRSIFDKITAAFASQESLQSSRGGTASQTSGSPSPHPRREIEVVGSSRTASRPNGHA